MSFISHKMRLLDDKKTFYLWVELGSLKKVLEFYKTQGYINPNTGEPFAEMSLWTSATRYAIEHPEEVRPIYIQAGSTLTDDEWEKWLIYKMMKVYGYQKNRCIKWAKLHNLYEKHKLVFDYTFNADHSFEDENFGAI